MICFGKKLDAVFVDAVVGVTDSDADVCFEELIEIARVF